MKKIFKIFIIVFIVLISAGCFDKKVGYVDRSKKRSKKEVKQFVISELKNRYHKNFTIISFKRELLYYCNGSVDFCNIDGRNYYKNTYDYQITVESEEGVKFYVNYIDAYTDTEKNEYNDTHFYENYEEEYREYYAKKNLEPNLKNIISKYTNNYEIIYTAKMENIYIWYNIYIMKDDYNTITNSFANINKFLIETSKNISKKIKINVYYGTTNTIKKEREERYTDKHYSESNINKKNFNQKLYNKLYAKIKGTSNSYLHQYYATYSYGKVEYDYIIYTVYNNK